MNFLKQKGNSFEFILTCYLRLTRKSIHYLFLHWIEIFFHEFFPHIFEISKKCVTFFHLLFIYQYNCHKRMQHESLGLLTAERACDLLHTKNTTLHNWQFQAHATCNLRVISDRFVMWFIKQTRIFQRISRFRTLCRTLIGFSALGKARQIKNMWHWPVKEVFFTSSAFCVSNKKNFAHIFFMLLKIMNQCHCFWKNKYTSIFSSSSHSIS